MYTVLMIIHVIISVALILVILAQTGKGGLDANLGSAAGSLLGGQGASKMLKNATRILAAVFMLSCLFLVFQVDKPQTAKSSGAVDKMREEAAKKVETTTPAPAPAETNQETQNQ